MITLTEKAVNAVGRFIAGSETPTAGLRIEVTDGGCSGYQYGLKLEGSHTPEDTVIDCGEVKVFIDPAVCRCSTACPSTFSTLLKVRASSYQPKCSKKLCLRYFV